MTPIRDIAFAAPADLNAAVADFTHMLEGMDPGDPRAAQELLPLVYEELRGLAAAKMANQPPGQTLQATALVHEAYLRLLGNGANSWQNRRHFFAAAAEAMRHILVDRARRKNAARHGGGLMRQPLDDMTVAADTTDENVIGIHEALETLGTRNPEAAELVKLRFFAGFTPAQAADILGLSERTARRLWVYARAWLFREITKTR